MPKHHLFWERKRYTTNLEIAFRELPEHIVEVDAETHSLIHKYQQPPEKPTVEDMRKAIEHSLKKRSERRSKFSD